MESNERPVTMEPMFHQLIFMQPPTVLGGKANIQVLDPGITIRDYFAGEAMLRITDNEGGFYITQCSRIALRAYELADAMMQERARWKGGKRV